MKDAVGARLRDLKRFYALLERLEAFHGGYRLLQDCSGHQDWPQRGIYFFRENGEKRTESGTGARIVRVGTHALTDASRTTLWKRLSQHKGTTKTGGGNHRGSIFRLLVGQALIQKRGYKFDAWNGRTASKDVRKSEIKLEQEVSEIIRQMPFIWLSIDDDPGPASQRGVIERNSIALLSNLGRPAIDDSSKNWLGRCSNRPKVRESGLWNQNHVEEIYDPSFLDILERHISGTKRTI